MHRESAAFSPIGPGRRPEGRIVETSALFYYYLFYHGRTRGTEVLADRAEQTAL